MYSPGENSSEYMEISQGTLNPLKLIPVTPKTLLNLTIEISPETLLIH
jgi:hypothetical protein